MMGVRGWWQRYLTWRRAEGVTATAAPTDQQLADGAWAGRIDADPGDVTAHATSNLGGGWAGSA